MTYQFDDFELDDARYELREGGEIVHAEPQVIALLLMLVANRERLVTKEEVIEHIWDGRVISESALSSRVKTARKLLGDDGKQQKYIKTVHGKGFRFVGNVETDTAEPDTTPSTYYPTSRTQLTVDLRPSVAVLPFRLIGVAGPYAPIAEALPSDLITELSKMRWLLVIARESSFQFHSVSDELHTVTDALNARYCLSGTMEIIGDKMMVGTELADSQDGGILWAERFSGEVDGVHQVRSDIVASVAATLDVQIPLNEARNAKQSPPPHLDAWTAYHLGLAHTYRFTREDNEKAQDLFLKAIDIDPDFARAHAGMAFTHCTNVTSRLVAEVEHSTNEAMRYAENALNCDARDPFANLCMGRAFWLVRNYEGSWHWANQSVELSPSYTQGLYARAWPENALGRMEDALVSINQAMRLSPLDPMSSVMRIVRASSHFLLDEKEAAADWAVKGAIQPGANGATWAITTAFLEDAGMSEKAKIWAKRTRENLPGITGGMMLPFLGFPDTPARERFVAALAKHGM